MLNYNRGIKYLLESYIGMDKKGIEKLRKLKTRSITYIKSYPNLLLSDYEVGTINFYNSWECTFPIFQKMNINNMEVLLLE